MTLMNPVSITITDAEGRLLERIAATRGSGTTSSGPLLPTDTFPQSSYVRWTTMQYLDCCFVASQRVYKLIPASGAGTSGTNYDETSYGYDIMKRRDRTVTPGGTITDLVIDVRGLVVSTWVGTNDTGATPTDPSGGGAVGNNMVVITSNVYDGGAGGGDGNLTQVTQAVDATTNRVTTMTYDFRNRLITTDGEIDYFEQRTYDNLDQLVQVDRFNTTGLGNLIGRWQTNFDDLGRSYQSIRYAVDPATGVVGNALTGNTWYDPSGNVIKSFPAGSSLFLKATYDGLGRKTAQYIAYGTDATYADVGSVAGNTVLEQVETAFDANSNVIQTTARQRYHNAPTTQLGPLQSPGATPNARVTYVAEYADPLGRPVNSANFGTYAGASFTRPTTAPARSDTILIHSATYDATGEVSLATDPAGMVTAFGYDAAGRKTILTENYSGSSGGGSLCTASDDTNRVTRFTYTPDGLQATLVAENLRTSDQTTTYTYGTTLTDSHVATSNLLRYVNYPDSTGGNDRIALTYDRQAAITTRRDQRGTIRSFNYDALGRMIHDRVTSLGTGVDGAVRRLSATFDVRGLVTKLTSHSNPTVGSGVVVNDVGLAYNSFGQVISDAQSHNLGVSGTTPKVQYSYANGSTNTIRPTTLTYPNGRVLTIGYGTSGGINDAASRVDGLIDGATTLVNYAYLGLGTTVQTTYPQPALQYTLIGVSGGTSPAGDIYWGLDQFGRIIDSHWCKTTAGNAVIDRIMYGYDRASNRIWRQNPVATAAGTKFDEFYTNDGLQRLKDMQRGTLNGTNTAITSPTFSQCWTLDPTGNWRGFNESTTGSTWTLTQARTSNTVNEITGITNSVGGAWTAPAYDPAGNMTTMPRPGTPSSSYTAVYDAWNRLVSIKAGTVDVQQYQYDARNFRTVILSYTSGVLSETRHSYFTSNWRCIEERTGTSTSAERQFVWGARYIDDCVLRDRDTTGGGTLNDRKYALQDANWNLSALTVSNGLVGERYAYSPYGKPIFLSSAFVPRSASSYAWEVLYCGYRYDAGTQLYSVRFRSYHPVLGSWCQRDRLGYVEGASLVSAYSTINSTDPSGRNSNSDFPSLVPPGFGLRPGEACAACHPVQPRRQCPQPSPEQERLSYLHCLMKWAYAIANTYFTDPSLTTLGLGKFQLNHIRGYRFPYSTALTTMDQMHYSWETYPTASIFGGIGVGMNIVPSANAHNFPIVPGFAVSHDYFWNSDTNAIATLVHEPQHDYNQTFLFGHDVSGFHIAGVPRGTTLEDNVLALFDFLENMRDPATGLNLFDYVKELCKSGTEPSSGLPKGSYWSGRVSKAEMALQDILKNIGYSVLP